MAPAAPAAPTAPAAVAPPPAPVKVSPAPLGVTYAGWRGNFGHAAQKVATFKEVGFRIVSFVPTYAYEGLNRIDLGSGPDGAELGAAIEVALRAGLSVVIKPHMDPPLYRPAFNVFRSENHSWRVNCPWRGYFDLDPMSDGYRSGIVFESLRAAKLALDKLASGPGASGPGASGPGANGPGANGPGANGPGANTPTTSGAAVPPIRLDLGAELMNAVVYGPERWEQLLAAAKTERRRLGLDGKVVLSHNFTHHFEILDDFVGRMNPKQRATLAKYIRGLDAIAVSQYMDLTVAVPQGDRGRRLPTVDEVARALVLHEKNFRQDILQTALGLRPSEIPPLHIGEFGVGRGGLQHPNLWDGAATPAQETDLAKEIARGHEGLMRYLSRGDGRTADSAVLWVLGPHYDIFGWDNPKFAIPDAAAAIRGGARVAPAP